jgi:hypothetical protein
MLNIGYTLPPVKRRGFYFTGFFKKMYLKKKFFKIFLHVVRHL